MHASFITSSEQETEKLGAAVGEQLFSGALLLLEGNLGAGKTVFARGVARGLGVTGPIQSPTFTLLRIYHGRIPLYHLDLYRLEEEEEVQELGLEDYLDDKGVMLVEWGERFEFFSSLPALIVRLSGAGSQRKVLFSAAKQEYKDLLHGINLPGRCKE